MRAYVNRGKKSEARGIIVVNRRYHSLTQGGCQGALDECNGDLTPIEDSHEFQPLENPHGRARLRHNLRMDFVNQQFAVSDKAPHVKNGHCDSSSQKASRFHAEDCTVCEPAVATLYGRPFPSMARHTAQEVNCRNQGDRNLNAPDGVPRAARNKLMCPR
jgi:hypothetical protein